MERNAEHYGLNPGKGMILGVILGGAMWVGLGYSLYALCIFGAI